LGFRTLFTPPLFRADIRGAGRREQSSVPVNRNNSGRPRIGFDLSFAKSPAGFRIHKIRRGFVTDRLRSDPRSQDLVRRMNFPK
jgi:hypothetical protein